MPNDKFNRYKRDDSERWAIFEYAKSHGNRAAAEKFGLSVIAVKEIRRRIRIRSLRDRERKGIASTSYRMRCLKYGHKKGLYGEILEDFVSYAMLQFADRGLTNAEWALAEHARLRIGRNGGKAELEHAGTIEFELDQDALITQPNDEPDLLIQFPKSLDGMIAQLVFKWGFKANEISDMMGLSESAICLRIKSVTEKMREKYGSEENK